MNSSMTIFGNLFVRNVIQKSYHSGVKIPYHVTLNIICRVVSLVNKSILGHQSLTLGDLRGICRAVGSEQEVPPFDNVLWESRVTEAR